MSNQVKAGSGLIKGCVVESGTCFVGGGRRSMPCAGVGRPASVHQVLTASLAKPSSCPCTDNERTLWRACRFRSWSRNSPHFMEPEGSLPHSQQPGICSFPGPDHINPCPHPFSLIFSNIILPSTPGSPKWSLSLSFSTKTLYAPLKTCHMPNPFILPNNIWWEEYSSWSSSLLFFSGFLLPCLSQA